MSVAPGRAGAMLATRSWGSAPLRELCEFHNGLWKGKKGPFETAAVIRNTNFTSAGRIDVTDVAILEVEARQLAKRRLQKNDIIIEKSGGGPKQPVGRVVLFDLDSDEKYSFSNFTSAIRVATPGKADPVYLHRVLYWWYASGRTEPLQSHSTGIRNLDFNAYKELEVPLPPLEEQKRIVAVLDQAFAALDRARAHAEANLADAAKLFQVELRSLFALGMSGWAKDQIQDVCTIKSGHTLPKPLEYADAELPYVKVADMNLEENRNGIVSSSRFARRDEIAPSQVFPVGTTIFPKRGGSILTNKKRLVLEEICADLNIMGVIPGASISPQFLYFFFLSVDMRKVGSGSAIPQINNYDVAPMEFSYPKSLDEQRVVTERLLELRSKTNTIAKSYRKRLTNLANLRQSLLQKAFSGQLT